MSSLLNRPTLVLNRNWQAINVAPVSRALILVWNDNARVVDPNDYQLFDWEGWAEQEIGDDDLYIQAVRQKIKVPEVISLMSYGDLPAATVTFSRRNVFKRDKYTCQFCGRQPGPDELTIDHVVPRAQGGESSWTNCVLACVSCNMKKADRTPKQAGMRLKKEPSQPVWKPSYSEHCSSMESWTKFVSEAYWNARLEP